MRVFLAIDVVQTASAKSTSSVQSALSGLSAEDILESLRTQISHPCVKIAREAHITLSFFGEISPAEVAMIQQQLKTIVCPTFTLATDSKLGVFSNWNRLRVIYVPVFYNKTLNQLAIKLQNMFPSLDTSRGEFLPHITLGRVKQEIADGGVYAAHLQSIRVEPSISWKVNELVLYESVLTVQGPVYKRLSSVKLQ